MSHIIVIDDDEVFLFQVKEALQLDNHCVVTAKDGVEALERIREENFDLIITDIMMPRVDGLKLLGEVRRQFPHIPVMMMSGQGTIDIAVSAMKGGAADFLVKPFSSDHLSVVVERVLRLRKLEEENRALREQISTRLNFQNLIGKNHQMQKIYDTISLVSPSDSTVLILGETGTGKDLLASTIHFNSIRKERPFVKVDCGAISEALLESELFGHEKGAFTNAYNQRIGRFEYANGGTVFLDEIGEISMHIQMKLLRILEEKKFERIGSNRTIEVDVRIIVATNKDLEEDTRCGKFRSDLFYRLNVIQIRIPPLRERSDDIPLLVDHFLNKIGNKLGRKPPRISPQALKSLMDYPWPGNVRELGNIIEKTLILQREEFIESIDLPDVSKDTGYTSGKSYLHFTFKVAKRMILEKFEKDYLIHLLSLELGNMNRASKKAGMDYKSFYEKIKHYGIDPHEFKKHA